MGFYEDIIKSLLEGDICTKKELHNAKIRLCKTHALKKIPTDGDILAHLPKTLTEEQREQITDIVRTKPMRTASGVAIIAVMTSPAVCPHGQCIPCPGGPTSNTPQSYTGHEPAAMRASLNDFDPFLQTTNRIKQLQAIGHSTEKIDFIIMGGTFTARDPYYQEWFVKRCYDAMNQQDSNTLSEALIINETSEHRCIGLTIETRPDWFRLQQIDSCLRYGATRVELGVQSIDDRILAGIKRGHTVSDTIQATELAKDAGFKICYHIMPGLPHTDEEKDIDDFRTLFTDPRFKPDMLKIYPTLVIEGTELHRKWLNDMYQPLTSEEATQRIHKMLQHLPRWVRIQRVQRDVPAPYIAAGVTKSNLRQLIHTENALHDSECPCIRCRELGHTTKEIDISQLHAQLTTQSYEASNSTEHFIAFEDLDHDILLAYLRLRYLKDSHRVELDQPSGIIRELKVVGTGLSLGTRHKAAIQHRGFGKRLITEAERITKDEYGTPIIHVISGIGVKQYYRKLGYHDNGYYLSKQLNTQ